MPRGRGELTPSLTVTFVGSGDAFGSGGRLQACILVEDGETRMLLDCGATSLTGMKGLRIDPSSISAIAVSHLHGDHFGGIPFLILDGQFSHRDRRLEVLGPPGTEQRLGETMEALYPGSSTVQRRFAVSVTEMEPAAHYRCGDAKFSAFPADHASGAPAYILRLEWHSRTVAYSGDSAWTPALIEASRGADLFICEAYFREKRVPYHLGYAELEEQLAEFDCKRIVLTHMTQEVIEASDVKVERAFDGMAIDL